MSLEYIDWDAGEVTVITLIGRITLGRGTERLRDAIQEVLGRGRKQILFDLHEVFYIDSSGLGEMVACLNRVNRAGGALKLMKLSTIARDLIATTRLYTVFEVYDAEKPALASFRQPVPPIATRGS